MTTIVNPLGEKQINFSGIAGDGLVGTQADPAVAALSNGNFVVVYEDPFQGGSDVDLLAHFFDANGNAISPPATTTLSNGVVGIDRGAAVTDHPAVAATANGGFAVIYTDATNEDINVRTYSAVSGVSAPFTVASPGGNPNIHGLDNAAIATFADGSMLVSFEVAFSATDHDVWDAILNSSGTGFVVPVNSVTSDNAFEGESRVATFGNTAALVFARDPGTINGGQDIVLNFLNSTGTALASPTFVFGTNSSDVWSHPDVAALNDGRFVVVAQDDTTGGIAAAVCNPTTHTVTNLIEFQNIMNFFTNPTDPHVVGVTGDTNDAFFVTFNSGGDVFEVLDYPGSSSTDLEVPSFTTGTQDENAVAANANGLFFAWQDAGSSNPNSTDTDTRIEGRAFQLLVLTPPPTPAPAGTTADMIMRDASTGFYEIYDLGNNAILGAGFLGQVGAEWQVAGVGAFNAPDTSDMILRNSNTGQFEIYDISNNNLTGAAPMGQVGLEWTVSGFGDFSSRTGETDMLMRNSNNGQFEIYDLANNAITSAAPMGQVGLEWSVAGFGDFSTRANESDMLMRNSNTGTFELYDIGNNQITSAAPMGQVGLEWSVAGLGNFSGNANETDMLMRNKNTGAFEIYDIRNNQLVSAAPMGQVGLEWSVVGFGPINGAGASDMLMRNSNTGAFEVYDIASNSITSAAGMGQVGLEWSVAGVAADPPGGAAAVNVQLAQAMASYGPANSVVHTGPPAAETASLPGSTAPLVAQVPRATSI
jgi:hypothetical protein